MTTDWTKQAMEKKEEIVETRKKIVFKTLSEVKQKRGIKILSYGNFSTGKTHFALSSNNKTFILDTENGAAPLADKFPDAQVINLSNMDNENIEEKDEVKNFDNYINTIDYLTSLPEGEVETIIIDSISDIWEWAQAYAKIKIFKIDILDRLKQQWDWGTINKIYNKPLQKLINSDCNVILTARESEVYAGAGQPTGNYDPKCQKKTPYVVDIVLYHQMTYINKQVQFNCKIKKCRQKGELINKIISDPSLGKIQELLK